MTPPSAERIGFIVEGELEERVLPGMLRRHLRARNSRLPVDRVIGRAIPDGGNRVRNKDWVAEQVKRLRQGKHDRIVVVADQESHPSPDAIRDRLKASGADLVIVASPKFERWLLADGEAIRTVLGVPRASDWRGGDPLSVLTALKPNYKKTADGTLLGVESRAGEWASQDREFCRLLQSVEQWLQLDPTPCRATPVKSDRR